MIISEKGENEGNANEKNTEEVIKNHTDQISNLNRQLGIAN